MGGICSILVITGLVIYASLTLRDLTKDPKYMNTPVTDYFSYSSNEVAYEIDTKMSTLAVSL